MLLAVVAVEAMVFHIQQAVQAAAVRVEILATQQQEQLTQAVVVVAFMETIPHPQAVQV
jgi:hypothetical protein